MTTRPPDVDIEETHSESPTYQGDSLVFEDLAESLRELPVRVVPLGAVLIGIVMSWASVSIPPLGINESVAGYGTDAGKFAVLVVGAILAAELLPLEGTYVRSAWVGGGIAMAVSVILTYMHFWSVFEEGRGMIEGNPFAAGVEMGFDLGIYLTLVAACMIAFIGLRMNPSTIEPIRHRL